MRAGDGSSWRPVSCMKTDQEKDVERHFVEKAPDDAWAIKLNPIGLRGLPDRMLLLAGGRVIFVELKIPTGRLSRLQQYVHERLRALGFRVEVLWTRQQVDEFYASIA